jgi:hypothetical protein
MRSKHERRHQSDPYTSRSLLSDRPRLRQRSSANGTDKVGCVIDIACTFVFGDLGIPTQRSCHYNAFSGIIVDKLGRDNSRRRDTFFDPLIYGSNNVMIGITIASVVTESIRARSATAMVYTGREKQQVSGSLTRLSFTPSRASQAAIVAAPIFSTSAGER